MSALGITWIAINWILRRKKNTAWIELWININTTIVELLIFKAYSHSNFITKIERWQNWVIWMSNDKLKLLLVGARLWLSNRMA